MLGDTINPNLGLQDYSAFGNASRVSGQAILDLVSGVTSTNDALKEEQKKIKETTKAGADAIKAAAILFPEMKPKLDLIGAQLDDPGRTPREKAAFASEITSLIDMGVRSNKDDRNFGLQERQITNQEKATAADIRAANASFDRNARIDAKAIENEALDSATEKVAGPVLLKNIKELLGPEFQGIKGATPEEDFGLAMKLAPFVPKEKEVELDLVDIPLGNGGSLKMNRDNKGNLSPLVLPPGLYTPPGEVAPGALPPPDGMVLPPKQEGPDVLLPGGRVSPGYTPPAAPSVTDAIAQQRLAMEQEKAARDATEAARRDQTGIAEAQGFINTLDELKNHPGFDNLFGGNFGVPVWIPGSKGADAEAVLSKVQGKAFLEAIQKMKGLGALSEKEGQTATKAYSSLTPKMSEAAAKKEIDSLKAQLALGIERAKTGKLVNPDGSPKALSSIPVDPAAAATERIRALIPK